MPQSVRQSAILARAREVGHVTVEEVSATLGVATQTIRRDLNALCEAGALMRVHGGAVLPSGTANLAYETRRRMAAAAKAAIGRACAARIPDGSSLFLNIGTTTEAVARALVGRRALRVITNNMNVAAILAPHEGCAVTVLGGQLRVADNGLTGPLTEAAVGEFRTDFAVIGASALDPGGELMDFDGAEIGVSRAMLSRTRTRIAVADAEKFSRTAPVRICSIHDLDALVTDAAVPPPFAAAARQAGTQITVAT